MLEFNWRLALRKLVGGKTKERSQLCLIGTEDGRIRDIEWDVQRACIVDPVSENAFIEDASNQMKSRENGKWYQVLGERSTLPICLMYATEIKDLRALIDAIFRTSTEAAKDNEYRKAKENKNWQRFTWLVSMAATAAIVLYVIKIWGA